MPIIVKDYKWSETEYDVSITLPLKGVKAAKADIFTTCDYIKVNYPPYLFEVNLFASVVEEKCNVRVGNGVIEFQLIKEDHGTMWGQIHSTDTSKAHVAIKREEALRLSQQREQELIEKRAKLKREEERFAIRQQMKLEQEKRDQLEREKEEEKKQALNKLQTDDIINTTDIWTGKPIKQPLAPRQSGKIVFSFTPRPFSTAARESKIQEEEEWLSKMAAARTIQPSGNKDDCINDRNPEFIKDKANSLFKVGNYDGAINALSEGINLNPNMPSLFANRAACFLKIGNNGKCIQDCTRALELYYPVVPSNYLTRTKVFVRRGTAYSNIGDIELSLQDYTAALQLSPNNISIKEDYKKLKELLTEQ